ncbi:MAG: hypothetical protein NVSMB59_24140 [Vulcanimicrobiaceae bacterium]
MSHLSLIDRGAFAPAFGGANAPPVAPAPQAAAPQPGAGGETERMEPLPLNGAPTHKIVE